MQQLGLDLVLGDACRAGTKAPGAKTHGADMGAGRDRGGAAHRRELAGVLDEAHLVEQQVQVALGRWALEAMPLVGTHRGEPAFDLCCEPRVDAEREPDHALVGKQLRQHSVELGERVGRIDTERRRCRLMPQATAVPDLALGVARAAEQRAAAVAREHQPGLGFAEAGEVVKVAVVAERKVVVAVALALGRRRHDRDAAAVARHRGGQLGAPALAIGEGRGGTFSQQGIHAPILTLCRGRG